MPAPESVRRVITRVLQVALGAGLFFFIGRYVWQQWDQIRHESLHPTWWLIVLAQAGFALGMGLQPFGSWLIVRALGADSTRPAIWHAFFVGQVAKYLPGSVWSLPGRAYLYHHRGLPAARSVEAIFWEASLTVTGAAILAVVGLPLLTGFDYVLVVVGLLGGFVLVFTGAVVFFRSPFLRGYLQRVHARNRLLTWLKTFELHLPPGKLITITLFYIIDWLVIGLGFAALAAAFGADLTAARWIQAAGLFAGAWAVGFLILVTPGGIGVRDGLLVIGLSTAASDPLPLVIAVAARLCWIGAEVIGLTFTSVLYGYMRSTVRTLR
jgi:hypothetical protein